MWSEMMKRAVALLSAVVIQTYPSPFPRPDVTKILENDKVIVWDGRWTAGRVSTMHQHKLDLVGVVLKGGRIRHTFPDGSTRDGALSSPGDVVFQKKGVIHTEEPLVDGAWTIGIELKDVPATAQAARTPQHATVQTAGDRSVLDNDRVAVWDHRWATKPRASAEYHDRDRLLVVLEGGDVRGTGHDGSATVSRLTVGQVIFETRGSSSREEAIAGSPRAVVVELK
jgi:hypothetical protein